MSRFGGAPQCPRCNKVVYMVEQMSGPGGLWHKRCLKCKECNKLLDSTSLRDKDDEVFCKTCYGRKWGPRGYGYAGGAAFLSTEDKMPHEILEEKKDTYTMAATPPLQTTPNPPRLPERPSLPERPVINTVPETRANPATPMTSFWSKTKPTSPSSVSPTLPSPASPSLSLGSQKSATPPYINSQRSFTPKKPNFGSSQSDICTGCRKPVYAIELVRVDDNKYHKACVKCCGCGSTVNPAKVLVKDSDLYCSKCHADVNLR